MLIPVVGGIAAYAVYSILNNRTRLVEQQTAKESTSPKKKTLSKNIPTDVFTAYLDPVDAIWDVNNEEYTFKVAREGESLDGRMRQDLAVQRSKVPVAGIY